MCMHDNNEKKHHHYHHHHYHVDMKTVMSKCTSTSLQQKQGSQLMLRAILPGSDLWFWKLQLPQGLHTFTHLGAAQHSHNPFDCYQFGVKHLAWGYFNRSCSGSGESCFFHTQIKFYSNFVCVMFSSTGNACIYVSSWRGYTVLHLRLFYYLI